MPVTEALAMRLNDEDRSKLEELARLLQRSRAGTIRLLIREAFTVLQDLNPEYETKKTTRV